jgi:hypothetical protein
MLNIAKKIYVGWGSQTSGLAEAEIIPQGDSGNEKRKIASFRNRWSTIKEFENVPLPGFTLQKSSKRSWSSTEVSWLVIDPRGFLVRISSQNLENILHVTGVTECLIQQRCVWAREDSQTRMTLVPVTAEEYNTAVKNTKLIEEKVSISDVQIGDTVMLQNELEGVYLGSLSIYGRLAATDVGKTEIKASAKLRRQVIEVEPGRYYFQIDSKILKIIKRTSTPLTKEAAAERVNAEINAQNAIFSGHGRFATGNAATSTITTHRGTSKFVSANAVPKLELSFREITKEEAKTTFLACLQDRDPYIIMGNDNGKYIIPDLPYFSTSATPNSFNTLELIDFDPTKRVNSISTKGFKETNYYYSRIEHRRTDKIDNYTKFYIIVKHVKNNTYI